MPIQLTDKVRTWAKKKREDNFSIREGFSNLIRSNIKSIID